MVPDVAVTLPPDPVAVIEYVTVPVIDFGVTVTVPLVGTVPDQLPSVEDAVTVVAFVVAIAHDTLLPSVMLVGVQESVAVGGAALTVTVTLWVVVPPAFVALMVYVAVAVGVAVAVPVKAVLVVRPEPEEPETESLVAVPPAFHVMTVDWPSVMMPGFAAIVGAGGATTVTMTEAVAVPPAPLQVRVYVVVTVGFLVAVPPAADNVSLQPPDATADVLLVQVAVRTVDPPAATLMLLAVSVAVGTGLLPRPPPPPPPWLHPLAIKRVAKVRATTRQRSRLYA